MPELRSLSKEYDSLSAGDTIKLLRSEFHEERLISLLILIRKFNKAPFSERTTIYELYLRNLSYINNWDLVDCSAPHIVGAYLEDKPKDTLYDFSRFGNLWERRIAVLSTHYYIKRGSFEETFKISQTLLKDKEDLIHKAVGWMLREVGRLDPEEEKKFLKTHYKSMPRTMLRYAIERFPETERKKYLKGAV